MRSKSNQPKIVAVVGPTLSGKTKLGLTLAERFNGVIISADSRQVYRGLDVGTNKEGQPGQWRHHPARYIDGIPQLIIDIADPGERFTLADWLKQARALAEEIWQAGQLPIVVGGTGLYVRALIENWQLGGQNPQLRQKLEMMSLIELQEQARDLGLNESDWQNRRRLVRTLERQQSPSQVVDSPTNQQSLVIMPIVERSVLYQKSDARVEQIFPRLCREVR
jgi:tRNA dimethylallyltransferase